MSAAGISSQTIPVVLAAAVLLVPMLRAVWVSCWLSSKTFRAFYTYSSLGAKRRSTVCLWIASWPGRQQEACILNRVNFEEGGWGPLAGLHEVFAAARCLINSSSQHRGAPPPLQRNENICKMGVERSERTENGIIEDTRGGLGEQRWMRRVGF